MIIMEGPGHLILVNVLEKVRVPQQSLDLRAAPSPDFLLTRQ